MKIKQLIHHAKLIVLIVMALSMTVGGGITYLNRLDSQDSQETAVIDEKSEDAISDQIIVSATNYLQLTSCEDIESAPVIDTAVEPVARMVIDISEDDIYLMACQVDVEAQIEPYDGKVGVANVIINRIKSSEFPNTVSDVIYEEGQFPPAHNGVLSQVLATGPTDECMQATLDALYGASTVGDYLYFNMSAGVRLSECRRYMQIGDTIFYMPY